MESGPDLPAELHERVIAALEDDNAPQTALDSLCAEHPEHADTIGRIARLYRALGDDEDTPVCAPRYRLGNVLGMGGVGVVYRADDTHLEREVALKFLRPEHRANPHARARFEREARVSARLQHPGIVPVYDLVTEGSSGPCLAMKLIAGRNFGDILAARQNTADDRVRHLSIFENICLTVGYAHERDIVHRDLKPLNVMVGEFGEVQVLDWGFAKFLDDSDTDISAPIPEDDEMSRPGSPFGSPPYMPPEQARAELEKLDRRSDVFALGAILCEILTGHPPYAEHESDGNTLLERAFAADLEPARARLRACAADAELVELAERCLSEETSERPKDARSVAAGLRHHLDTVEERAHDAELAAAAARGRAERERQARRLTISLAIAVFVLAALGTGTAWWSAKTRADEIHRTEQLVRDEWAAFDTYATEARLALEANDDDRAAARWDDAVLRAERAPQLLEEAGIGADESLLVDRAAERADEARREQSAADRLITQRTSERELRDRLRIGRLPTHARPGGAMFEQAQRKQVDKAFTKAFADFGIDPTTAPNALVMQLLDESRRDVAVALDLWAIARKSLGLERWAVVLAAADALDATPSRRKARDLLRRDEFTRDDVIAIRDGLSDADRTTEIALVLASLFVVTNASADASQLLEALERRHPDDFDVVLALGMSHEFADPPNFAAALRAYEAARALQPRSLEVRHRLGMVLQYEGHWDEALEEWRELDRIDPENGHWAYHIGSLHIRHGRFEDAEPAFERAVRLAPNDGYSWGNLGISRFQQRKMESAEPALRRAVEIDPRIGRAQEFLARLLRRTERAEEALKHIELAAESIGTDDPSIQYVFASIFLPLGRAQEAIEWATKAARSQPSNASAHRIIADAAFVLRNYELSADAFERAARYYDNRAFRAGKGRALAHLGRDREAIEAYRSALALRDMTVHSSQLHFWIGERWFALADDQRALESFQAAIESRQDFAEAWCNAGLALLRIGKPEEARTHLKRGDALGQSRPNWIFGADAWISDAQELIEVAERLDELKRPDSSSSAKELFTAALYTFRNGQLNESRSFLRRGLAEQPTSHVDGGGGWLIDAACVALAAAEREADPKIRAAMLDRAYAHVDAHVTGLRTDFDEFAPLWVKSEFSRLQRMPGLAFVRGKALDSLPESEAARWRDVWTRLER